MRVGEVVADVRADGPASIAWRAVRRAGRHASAACFYPDAPIAAARILGPVTAYRDGAQWREVSAAAPGARARSPLGRLLLAIVSGLAAIDVRLARLAANALRLRRESMPNAVAPD